MRLSDLASDLRLEDLTPQLDDDGTLDVTRGYASDLLSDVLANAPTGGVLVTLQVHLNVIAVAGHADLAAVIFTSNRRPDDDVVAKAVAEGVHLFTTPADTFEAVGVLHAHGVKGRDA